MAAKKKVSFEQQMEALETMVSAMEAGGMTLEETVTSYEKCLQAIAGLKKELDTATQRLTVLRRRADGAEEEVPLEDDE